VPQLAGWQNFYVIVGSSAGALIGLQFVVIALMATRGSTAGRSAMRAFATPTIVFFSSVVVLAGVLNIPHQTKQSLMTMLVVFGALGTLYIVRVAFHILRQGLYSPDLEDRMFFVGLPALTYAVLIVGGVFVGVDARVGLDITAGCAMVLLLIGVHNAWDSAVWLSADHEEPPPAA